MALRIEPRLLLAGLERVLRMRLGRMNRYMKAVMLLLQENRIGHVDLRNEDGLNEGHVSYS